MKPIRSHRLHIFQGTFVAASYLITQLAPAAETPPAVEWQASFGGINEENCHVIVATGDGGFLLGGDSLSGNSATKTVANYGGFDGWLVKVDAAGNQLWDKAFGGVDGDSLQAVAPTPDGGALLGLTSLSGISGSKTSPNYGARDLWLVKVNANGTKLWDRSFGGSDTDYLPAIMPAGDMGFVVAAMSLSGASGNKTSDGFGDYDFWVFKVDADGTMVWDRSFGGSDRERPFPDQYTPLRIVPSGDGGFLIGGSSLSVQSGNKTSPNYGFADYWLVKIDANGDKLWDQTYGGDSDDRFSTLAPTSDGGFLLAGDSVSDISGNRTVAKVGIADLWVVKVDAHGTKLWDTSFGYADSSMNQPLIVPSSDGGFHLCAWGGPLRRDADYWLLKIDANGEKLWEQAYGGNGGEYLETFMSTADGGLLLGGESGSGLSRNKTSPNYGSEDFWVIKLAIPRPKLAIELTANGARVSWPLSAQECLLEGTTTLGSSPAEMIWSAVPGSYETNGTSISTTVPFSTNKFFRLRTP